MRSFGLWYKRNEKEKDAPVFSVHINFWSEEVKKENCVPALDIGIKIVHFRSANEVIFQCPFVVTNDQVTDLVTKLHRIENANIVFNTDGDVQAKESYSVFSFVKKNVKESLLLFPLHQPIDGIYTLRQVSDKTEIAFDFSKFNEYLKQRKEFDDINEVYIRFRVATSEMKNNIYFDSEPSNRSFESAFSGTRIFDFKVNEKRNLGSKTVSNKILNKYEFAQIDCIHLLVMEPSSYDVEAFASTQMTCRELEGDLWSDYLDSNINTSKGRILAYHWKFGNEFSCLIKVKYSKTNFKTLLGYILIVLGLGVFGSTIVATIQELLCTWNFLWLSAGISIVLFLIGLMLGRDK